ncbi:MAG: type II secretion system major pseudopilin GspG [Planctomycetota bacterium]
MQNSEVKTGNRKRKTVKAFTLIELLVVILIISMLAVFVAPKMLKTVSKAKMDIAKAKMRDIENAIERFCIDCGRYPTDAEGLKVLIDPPEDVEEKWRGRYLKPSELLDPWKNPYIYVEEGERNPGSYDLVSLGADGKQGGEGDDEDIYND